MKRDLSRYPEQKWDSGDGSAWGTQLMRMSYFFSGLFLGVCTLGLVAAPAQAKKKTIKVVERTIETDEEEAPPKAQPTSKTEVMVGVRGGGTVISGAGAGHFSAFGGAALGGNHAFLITGQLGVAFSGGAGALIGAALGYRGYFTEGNVRIGVTAALEPEVWLPSGGTVFLVGPSVGPIVKVGPVAIGLSFAFRYVTVSSRGLGASGFAFSPTLHAGFTF